MRLAKCEVRNEQLKTSSLQHVVHNQVHGSSTCTSKTDDIVPTSSGTSVKECSANCLPFRKRKVERSESDTCMCSCDGDVVGKPPDAANAMFESTRTCLVNDAELAGFRHDSFRENADKYASSNPEFESGSKISNLCEFKKVGDTEIDKFERDILSCMDQEIDVAANSGVTEKNENFTTCLDVDIEMEKCSLDMNDIDTEITTRVVSRDVRLTEHVVAMPSIECIDSASKVGKYSLSFPKLTSYAEQVDIEYVNDIQLNRHYCHVLESYRTQKPGSYLSLLYITPHLSFLGIQAARMGYNKVTMATPEEHQNTLHQVAELNGCKRGEIVLTELSDLNDLEMQVDVIVCDVVESCGALRQQVFEDLVYHRYKHILSDMYNFV